MGISEGDTRIIPELDILILEIGDKKSETERILGQLERKTYIPSEVFSVLFDYDFFQEIIDGKFDIYFINDKGVKRECESYISCANILKEEIDKATGPTSIAKKISSSEKARLAIADTQNISEILRLLKEADKAKYLESDEKTMKTYTALAKIRVNVENLILYSIKEKIKRSKSKIKSFDLPEPKLEDI